MSRIAEAGARAGFTLPDEEAMQWNAERTAADALLEDAGTHPKNPRAETIDFLSRRSESAEAGELAAAIGRIFLSPESTVRSVLFCSVPGDRMTEVAWRSAELLASQSGKPIAFVEEPSNRIAPATRHGLITQIEWSDDDDVADSAAGTTSVTVGEQIPDLLPRFDFVLVSAAVRTAAELTALASQVDGVIVVVVENATSVDAAQSLVTSLRNASVALLGTVFVTDRSEHLGPTIFDLKR